MNLLQALILGIVQGLTEFLPISSTAHLRIVPELLGWEDPGAAYTAIIQLGTIHSSKKDPIALQYFNNAFRLDTTDVFPLYARGMYYQQLGEYEKAKEEYRKSIHYNSDYINSFFATGWILLQQDSLEKAWRQFDIVTKLEPTDAEAYYNRGLASELMGKTQDALADYKQAVIFDETYKEAQEGVRRLSGK